MTTGPSSVEVRSVASWSAVGSIEEAVMAMILCLTGNLSIVFPAQCSVFDQPHPMRAAWGTTSGVAREIGLGNLGRTPKVPTRQSGGDAAPTLGWWQPPVRGAR